MKKLIVLTLVVSLNVFCYSQTDIIPYKDSNTSYFDTISRVNVGIYGNWNLNKISNISSFELEGYKNSSFEFGTEVRYRIFRRVSFDFGVSYSKLSKLNITCHNCLLKGNNKELTIKKDNTIDYAKTTLGYDYVKFPVGFRYNFNDDYNNAFSISGGVSIVLKAFTSNNRQDLFRADTAFDITSILSKVYHTENSFVTQLGYYITAGKSFHVLNNINLQVELSYQYMPKFYYIRKSHLSLYGIKFTTFF